MFVQNFFPGCWQFFLYQLVCFTKSCFTSPSPKPVKASDFGTPVLLFRHVFFLFTSFGKGMDFGYLNCRNKVIRLARCSDCIWNEDRTRKLVLQLTDHFMQGRSKHIIFNCFRTKALWHLNVHCNISPFKMKPFILWPNIYFFIFFVAAAQMELLYGTKRKLVTLIFFTFYVEGHFFPLCKFMY